MFNKTLVIVFIIDVYYGYGPGSKTQSFNLYPFLILSVRNGLSVSFGTDVPCNYDDNKQSTIIPWKSRSRTEITENIDWFKHRAGLGHLQKH